MAYEMIKDGHIFLFTVRQGENEDLLLSKYNFHFKRIGEKRKSKYGKMFGLIDFSLKILIHAVRFKANLFISHGSMYAGIAAKILRKPHIALEDSGNMEQIRISKPFSTVILTPDILPVNLGAKQILYKSYHEIAYLHPDYYKPSEEIFQYLKIDKNLKYAIVRFVHWGATHDIGQQGLSAKNKMELINLLAKNHRVYISSETPLPEELNKYKIQIPFELMHDALFHASIYVGEGATMAAEAGILGTPSVYISTIRRCYNDDQEKYGTVYNFNHFDAARKKIVSIIEDKNSKIFSRKKKELMLADKINLTRFLVWFVSSFPESDKIMKMNPDYQLEFR
jgi:predicted glycosyltransferase